MIDFLDKYIYYSFKSMGHYKEFQNTIIINAIKPQFIIVYLGSLLSIVFDRTLTH